MKHPQFAENAGEGRLARVFLLPGALHCTSAPSLVTTVLGSCVAVCLTDRSRRHGGINHFLLPRAGSDKPSLRYGDHSIERLVDAMLRLGSNIGDLDAKLFGGAAVLPMNTTDNNVGSKNVDVALERLTVLGIPVLARRTGGKNGMTIRLLTESGDVLVRRIASSAGRQAGPLLAAHDSNRT